MDSSKSTDIQGPTVEKDGKNRFFDDVLEPPEWLTQDYVEAALQKYESDPKLKITSYGLSPCTKPGDNFMGVIFRAGISFLSRGKQRSESYIIKIEVFLEGAKKDMVAGAATVFDVEGRVYSILLPKIQDLLKNIGDDEIIAPGLIHWGTDPQCLIFEDACADKFEMVRMPTPFEKTEMVARKLGKFHALSYFMAEEQKDTSLESFTQSMFSGMEEVNWTFFKSFLDTLCEMACEWDLGTIAYKLKVLQPKIMKILEEKAKAKPSGQGINVLNHGDLHIRNLLFRFKEEDKTKFQDIRLIDFQCSSYGSPAIDLASLYYMIGDPECSEKHKDQLLGIYYEQFKGTLTALGYLGPKPTLLDFQLEMLKNGLFELFNAAVMLIFFYMDYNNMAEDDFMDPAKMPKLARIAYDHPDMKRILMRLLPELMYKGVLDV